MEKNLERTIYKYSINVVGIDIPTKPVKIVFKDEFEKLMDYMNKLPKNQIKQDLVQSEKVVYLEEYTKRKERGFNIYELKLVSLKYNQTREVLDKETLESKGRLKSYNDGDKEYNHVVISEKDGRVTAVFEYNYYGLQSLGKVIYYLNEMSNNYFKSKDESPYYYLEAQNEVDRDFLEELNKLTKITAATLVIDRERLGTTDFSRLAGRDELDHDIEITFKNSKKNTIPKSIIKEYYEEKNNSKNNKSTVKRIYVSGKNENNKVKLDTEEMKQKEKITVKTNKYGEINSEEIFELLKKYLMEE